MRLPLVGLQPDSDARLQAVLARSGLLPPAAATPAAAQRAPSTPEHPPAAAAVAASEGGGQAPPPSACPTSNSASAAAPGAAAPTRKYRVGVLGATGAVGQRFVQLLATHPWFELTHLGASSRSAGKLYAAATQWSVSADCPAVAAAMAVVGCAPADMPGVELVFSALDADVAGEAEPAFRDAGVPVFSNARSFRMAPDVPLCVPPVNGGHLDVVRAQPSYAASGGFIVTNANCSTTGMVVALAPLHAAFGVVAATVTTLQAVSGAGYPGLPSLDILDNVIPFIAGEEDKLESEYRKILGAHAPGGGSGAAPTLVEAAFPLSAMVNRVHVRDGHSLAISLKLQTPASPAEVVAALRAWRPDPLVAGLPSAPAHFIEVRRALREAPPRRRCRPPRSSHPSHPPPPPPPRSPARLPPPTRRCARRPTARSRGWTATRAAASRRWWGGCAPTPSPRSSCRCCRTTRSWAPRAAASSMRSSRWPRGWCGTSRSARACRDPIAIVTYTAATRAHTRRGARARFWAYYRYRAFNLMVMHVIMSTVYGARPRHRRRKISSQICRRPRSQDVNGIGLGFMIIRVTRRDRRDLGSGPRGADLESTDSRPNPSRRPATPWRPRTPPSPTRTRGGGRTGACCRASPWRPRPRRA